MDRMRKPTVHEIAKRAHVSTATVSRVINGGSGVDAATRAMVWRVIRELNYDVVRHPDRLAGILVFAPRASFYNAQWRLAVSGVLHEASRHSIPVVFSNATSPREVESMIHSTIRCDGVQGVIEACLPIDWDPLVLPDDGAYIAKVPMLMKNPGHGVNVDMYDQFFSLTQELITLGHTRIALAVNAVQYWPVHRRIRGFVDACRAARIDAHEIATIMPSWKAGAWLERRLNLNPRPTALIGGTSELSKLLFAELLRMRIAVPADLSYAGVGHSLPYEKPIFDTLEQPTFELGRETVRLLQRVVTRPGTESVSVTLPAKLVKVGTTGPPPSAP